jgi:Transposase DDE domain group 1
MQSFKIEFTDKEITPWGGMVLLQKMLDRVAFKKVIEDCEYLPQPGSNRGYPVYTILESFMVSVWSGAVRFIHTETTRRDTPLATVFGWKEAPGQDVYKRYFGKFNQSINHHVFGYLQEWFYSQLLFDNFTIDFDSSVLTRYGTQEGAKKGYNKAKPGRNSHHPLMAFVADCNMVANFWLRSGDAHTANNFKGFVQDTLSRLKNKKVGLVRLDSGFYDQDIFKFLEDEHLPYITAVPFYAPIQKLIAGQQTWLQLSDGIETASTSYQSEDWDKPRRIVLVRQLIKERPKATGKQLKLFKEEGIYKQYRYTAYVTSMDFAAPEIWRMYRGRGDAENRIKEVKYDFGFDSFCMQNFFATEAALNMVMIAYNFMSLFRQFIIGSQTQQRLSTLRFQTFAIGAYLVKDGRNVVLKLALTLKRREWFTGLWNISNHFSTPVKVSNA